MTSASRLRPLRLLLLLLAPAALGCVVAPARAHARIPLHRVRRLPSDLEVGGDLTGVPAGQTRFVRYSDLLRLTQKRITAVNDANFGHPVHLSGVLLEALPALLAGRHDAQMITALASDGYKTNYPAAYLRRHHPVLILKVSGQPQSVWAHLRGGAILGPYIISHAHFTPSFQVLAHQDEAQIPWGVVRVDVRREAAVYSGIVPKGPSAAEMSVQQGFRIASQNCFRCHDEHGEGGSKANRSWQVVARRSLADPQYFNGYVHNPSALNPASRMSGSPAYDGDTLDALRAYFKLFASPRTDFEEGLAE